MTRSYYTFEANAENTMQVNYYYVRHEYQNEDHIIRLFGNRKTDAQAIVKIWKVAGVKDNALVMIFNDCKEAEQKFRALVDDELLGLY